MKVYVRYLGLILLEKELPPGEYILGRDKDCDLPLAHEYISRRHGKVYFQDDQWFYKDLRDKGVATHLEPVALSSGKLVDLGHGIQLLNEQQLWDGKTEISQLHDISNLSKQLSHNRQKLVWLALAFASFLALTLFSRLHTLWKTPMDTNTLLSYVRPKIVEFEHIRDPKLVDELKKYAKLKDDDFLDHAGFCSGFVVAPNVVLTAFHCLRGAVLAEVNTNFQIKTQQGKQLKPTKVLGFDFKKDYLFLEVPGLDQAGQLRFSKGYSLGEKVFTVGNVGGEGIAIREGIMASTTQDPNDPKIEYIRYSAPASPGNSGGPLINSYGEVVGLVFARSFAENYNLGTASEHLLAGKKMFVDQKTTQKVEIKFEGYLDFNPEELLLTFGYPYLPVWNDNQEYPRMFQKVKFDVEVPSLFRDFPKEFSENCNQAVKQTFNEVLAQMDKAKESEGQWKHLLSEDSKVFFAPDYFDSAMYLYRQKELIPEQISLHVPLGQRTLKEYAKKLKQSEIGLPPYETFVQQIDEDLSQKKSKPQFLYHAESNVKRTLSYIPELVGKYSPKALVVQWSESREIKPAEVLQNIFGEEGLMFSTYTFPFVRPKSMKDFRIKELPSEATRQVLKDRNQRDWTLFTWAALDQTLEAYCTAVPQGYFCVSRGTFLRDPELVRLSQVNFVEYYLSEYFIHTPFWKMDALKEFVAQSPGTSAVWSDIDIVQLPGNKVKLTFKTLGLVVETSGSVSKDMIRVVGALTKTSGATEPQWMAFGLDHLKNTAQGLSWCTIAMEPADQVEHPSFKELQKSAAKKPAIKAEKFLFKKGNFVVKTWSYCNPIEIKSENKPVETKYNISLPYDVKLSPL